MRFGDLTIFYVKFRFRENKRLNENVSCHLVIASSFLVQLVSQFGANNGAQHQRSFGTQQLDLFITLWWSSKLMTLMTSLNGKRK